MDNQQGPTINIYPMELCSMLCGSLDGSLRENGYMYMYGWVPLQFTWNYHTIFRQLYIKKFKKKNKKQLKVSNFMSSMQYICPRGYCDQHIRWFYKCYHGPYLHHYHLHHINHQDGLLPTRPKANIISAQLGCSAVLLLDPWLEAWPWKHPRHPCEAFRLFLELPLVWWG